MRITYDIWVSAKREKDRNGEFLGRTASGWANSLCQSPCLSVELGGGSSEHEHNALVSLGEAIVKHAKLDISVEEADAMVAEEEETELY